MGGLLLALGSFAAGSGLRPEGRKLTATQRKRRLRAVKLCTAQGPNCKVVERAGQPRDLTGVACVCH